MKLYIMRHSETDWNREGRVQGHTDIHLNINGMEIAAITGDGMANIPIDLCYSSPLVRAQETAGLILARNKHYIEQGAITKLDDRLKELNFGEWEGKIYNPTFGEIDRDEYHRFFREKNPDFIPENAETLSEVIERTSDFLKDISSREEYKDKSILVMSHGCSIRCMLRQFYEEENYFTHPRVIYNCEAQILEADNSGNLYISKPDVLYYDESLAKDFYSLKPEKSNCK